MKRVAWILILLCLLPCTALAANGDLPDIEAFSGGLVEIDPNRTDEKDFRIEKVYIGTDEDVLFVATEYISLLTEKYGLAEICHFIHATEKSNYFDWAFKYTGNEPEIGTSNVFSTSGAWGINDYQVRIEYCQSDYYGLQYVLINYRPEFNYIDTGDRINLSAKPTAVPTAKPTAEPEECPVCDGSGDCPECGGDMWVWGYEWEYVNGSPVSVNKNRLCDGIYCYGGSCDKCGGDGVL